MPSSSFSESFFLKQKPFRLLVCPGVMQLLAGVSAIEAHAKKTDTTLPIIAIVYELYSDDTKHFFDTIKKCGLILGVEKVIYLDENQILSSLNNLIFNFNSSNYIGEINLKSILGELLDAKELWLNGNFSKLSKILNLSYEHNTYCYGDGPGVFISDTNNVFFKPELISHKSISKKNLILNLKKFIFQRNLNLNKKSFFTKGYMLFSKGMDDNPEFEVYEKEIPLKNNLQKILLNIGINKILNNNLEAEEIVQSKNITILLLSNHSEAKRLEISDEISGYLDIILKNKNSLILIKPHPRDSNKKIVLLIKKLEEYNIKFIIINNSLSKYLPAELLFEHLVSINKPFKVFASSTIVYTIAAFYNTNPEIGFPKEFIINNFYPNMIETRFRHDKILRDFTNKILKNKHEL